MVILEPGKFYLSKNEYVWCCYKTDKKSEIHSYAHCIRLIDSRVEYFYKDGRYDEKGLREHTLVEEIKYEDKYYECA